MLRAKHVLDADLIILSEYNAKHQNFYTRNYEAKAEKPTTTNIA